MIRAIPYTSIWFGAIMWVLIGGGLLVGTTYLLYQDFLFAEYGKSVTATVERKFLQVGQGKHGPTYTPCLDYRYQAPGMTVNCENTVRRDTYQRVSTGGTMSVFYVSSDPGDHRIDMPAENQMISLISWILVAGTLLVTVGGFFGLRYQIRRNKINQELLASGITCTGRVTEIKFDIVGKANTRRYYLLFAFRDNIGREVSGRTWYLKRGYENLWALQSPITVYYSPRNSEVFTVDLNSGPTRS